MRNLASAGAVAVLAGHWPHPSVWIEEGEGTSGDGSGCRFGSRAMVVEKWLELGGSVHGADSGDLKLWIRAGREETGEMVQIM